MGKKYFLIAVLVLIAFGGGIFYAAKFFRDSFEHGINAQVYSDLVEIELSSRAQAAILYTSVPESFPLSKGFAELFFVGDVMLSRGIAYQIKKNGGEVQFPFARVAARISAADITFGNLEGPISARGENQGSMYSFRADPRVIEGLVYAGFDVMSLANNHMWDYGADALTDTIDILRTNNIRAVGAGKNLEDANAPAILTVGDARVAFFAYTNLYPKSLSAGAASPGVSAFDLERAKTAIQKLKESRAADIVVVSFHWGEEYKTQANESQKNIAYALADAGADLIVGHHPHVVQEVEQYKKSWIAYSLGNFVFDQNFSEDTSHGLVLSVMFSKNGVHAVTPIPVSFTPSFQPLFPREE